MPLEINQPLDSEGLAKPAYFVNRFQLVGLAPGLVRVAFGEAYGEPPVINYRAALVMTLDDARQLADAITKGLDAVAAAAVPTKPAN